MNIIFITTTILLLTTLATAKKSKAENYRLPTTVLPTNYKLELTIDPDANTYHGFVDITVTATNATNEIHLHAPPQYLNITNDVVLLDYKDDCNFEAIVKDDEIIIITCSRKLEGKHTLTMEFHGKYSTEDMDGIYTSTYEEEGSKMVLVATQFEPTFARRMFPCFDEPSFKATFQVFVTHPEDYLVLANTQPEKQFAVGPGKIQTQFKTTPKMSTYLLALVVSKFVVKTSSAKSNYDYKVYARPGAKDYMNIATTYGSQLIDIMGEFTGIAYEKLGNDQIYQVAIPDFSAGAMENWGLITYREVDLLDDGNKTTALSKQRIITTIAHELSHQWFGDFVTLDWWSDTWLNEGFATYFEYHNPDLLKGENLELGKQFVIDVLQEVLQKDALTSSLPLSSPEEEVNSLAEDNNKFDDISYYKGASIVRMIKGFVGDELFQKGLQSYLSLNQYKNTNPDILLEELQAVNNTVGYDIPEIMEKWIFEAGYPLVTAKLNDSGVVHLHQERFTMVESKDLETTEWWVPISYTTSDERDFSIRTKLVMKPNSTTEIEINEGSWIIINLQQTGFFRVNYDDTLWDRIIDALNDDDRRDIHVLNRAQLIDDVFNIARVGRIDYEKVFKLTSYLSSETEYYPWASALNAIDYLRGKLDETSVSLLNSLTLQWINNAFQNSTEPTTHIEHVRDSLILDWACRLGQDECVKYALDTFNSFKVTKTLPDYNKRGVVFCYALSNSKNPDEDYQFLYDVFKKSTSSVEQNVILSSLGCISDSSVLSKYLSETISANSPIRKQDAANVFRSVYSTSKTGLGVALKFLEDNLKKVVEKYKGLTSLSTIFTGIAEEITKDEDADRLKKLIDDNKDVEEIEIVGQQAVDIITVNKIWTETYGSKVKDVLVSMNQNMANIYKPNVMLQIVVGLVVTYLLSFN